MPEVHIDWRYPEPKTALDKLVGPGANDLELLIQFLPPTTAAVCAFSCVPFPLWQRTLFALLVLDLVGGIATNATGAAKRWYHRPGQGFREHMSFIAVHGIQIGLIVTAFGVSMIVGLVAYVYLLVAALFILTSPLVIQRAVAFLALAGALVISLYTLKVPPGLEWFFPLLYLKLLGSHLPREEPYRSI